MSFDHVTIIELLIRASFSTIPTDSLCLRVTQMPRSPDLAIFVLTTDDRQTDKTDCFTPYCACARGVIMLRYPGIAQPDGPLHNRMTPCALARGRTCVRNKFYTTMGGVSAGLCVYRPRRKCGLNTNYERNHLLSLWFYIHGEAEYNSYWKRGRHFQLGAWLPLQCNSVRFHRTGIVDTLQASLCDQSYCWGKIELPSIRCGYSI